MGKKRNSHFGQTNQKNLFPEPETPKIPVPVPIPENVVKCPQCGGSAAKSLKWSVREGTYYCTGACSYGDNFYFTYEEKTK